MGYCLNPYCPSPDDPRNLENVTCRHCGSDLILCDRYRVRGLLSDHSGFAKIFEVWDGTTVKILKVLKAEHNTSEKIVSLFKQEALVLSQLHHPGIPRIDDHGYFEYSPRDSAYPLHCFVMEKIDGPNLSQWMHQQGNLLISESQALDWLEQLTTILHLVHQKNYFHRDIKLQNIMMRSTGQLVLIDFGTAREMTYTYLAKAGQSGNITRVSSAGYTPPEQQQGHAVPQSDFFALGRTFVYLLTGKTLEDRDIYDPLANEFRWRHHAPDLSPAFMAFIDQLMAHRAADRPPDTQTMLRQIVALKRSLSQPDNFLVSATPPADLTRLPETALQVSPESPTVPQESPDRRSWPLGLGIAIALLLGGYGSWQVYQVVQLPTITQTLPRGFTGHQSFINSVTISPDSQTVITGSADKTIKVWDLATGAILRTLTGHDSFVNAIALSPDGQFLISGSADKTIKVWQINTGQLIRTLTGHTNFVDTLILSDDGQTLVSTGADRTIRIWDWQRDAPPQTLTGHQGFINALALSSDGRTLMSGSADHRVKVWDLITGKVRHTLEGHTGFINCLVVSPDGQWVASGSADKTIRIWDVKTGRVLKVLNGHQGFVNDLAISPDGRWLVSGSADHQVKVWDMTDGTLHHTLTGHLSFVNRIKISQDGRWIVSASADQTIRLWNLKTGDAIATLTGYPHHINDFAISPDDQFVVTGSGASQLAIWPVEL
ncbi:serine/threonine-protein kinase [Spirulina major]|uniref:serine/threonine-protein kinase n=1 Tax=Spirulina major TaxID=270636 RepID=UPI000933B083|nr:serine/threonine-protein kinase [Spirulina major]